MLLGNLGLQFGDSPLNNAMNQISLTQLWSLGLLAYGYKLWRNGTWLKSAAIALLPQLLLLAAVIFLFGGGAEVSVSSAGAESGGGSYAISVTL